MESLFPRCNTNTDTATPSQRCDGTLLPIMLSDQSDRFETLIWKCSECGRVIKFYGKDA